MNLGRFGQPSDPLAGLAKMHDHAHQDETVMRHALALARRGLGKTWPNPAVGAVIWRPGPQGPLILGRGFTRPGGRPHAETQAIAMAGEAARGATLTVTLEPCSHHGRTPPCSDAILQAGLARVVSAIEDPDPRVNGRGHIRLRAHEVDVKVGVLAREARRANLGFIRRVVDGRPMVTLKLAQTADGFAGRRPGPRLMITGEAAQARVHLMRFQHDAVLAGIGTVLADDPYLTCRLPGLASASPVRIVLDTDLRLPVTSRLVAGARNGRVWVLAAPDASPAGEAALAGFGVEVLRVARDKSGRGLDLAAALAVLATRGLTRVFCEGGPTLAAALCSAGLVDQVVLLTGSEPACADSPGRETGLVPALSPHLLAQLANAAVFEPGPLIPLGRDVMQQFYRMF